MTRAMAVAHRAQVQRSVKERLESKRQWMLALMCEEDRKFYRHYDVGTLIALRRSERLNMLPGTEDHG